MKELFRVVETFDDGSAKLEILTKQDISLAEVESTDKVIVKVQDGSVIRIGEAFYIWDGSTGKLDYMG